MDRTLSEVIGDFGQVGVMLTAAVLAAALSRRSFHARWLLIAVAVIVVHDFALTRGWWMVPSPGFIDRGHWNWSGKLLAIAATLAMVSLPMFGWRRAGLTLRQDPANWRGAWIGAGIVLAAIVGLSLYFPNDAGDAEAVAFQLTMPGLEEEIFYRGLLLLALNEAFRGRVKVLGARMGWGAVLTSLLFGLIHGLSFEDGAFSFTAIAFLTTGLSGLLLAWFREKSGSVVLPILLHNAGNTLPMLI